MVSEKKTNMKRGLKRKTKGEIIFNMANNLLMLLLLTAMAYPFINQIAISFSSNTAIVSGHVNLYPIGFNTDAYQSVLNDRNFFIAMKNTVLYTVDCVVIQMFLTTMFAYPLSKKNLKGRKIIMSVLIFSMMFGTGGLIPNYLLIKNLGMIDSYWSLILPGAVSIWNVIVLKNFFLQIPESLEEAATIDGANIYQVFFKIVLPLSRPVLASLTLFVAVAAWNQFFNCLMYITTPSKKLLQVYLNDILQANTIPASGMMSSGSGAASEKVTNSEALKAASIMCTTLPILCVYPFVQKHFMAGIMLGSVKG